MTEIFQNKGTQPKEAANILKEKRGNLTPKEKYCLRTPAGEVLSILEKNHDTDLIRTSLKRKGTWGIETLYKNKVITKNYGTVETS